jgi:hypothetical protein
MAALGVELLHNAATHLGGNPCALLLSYLSTAPAGFSCGFPLFKAPYYIKETGGEKVAPFLAAIWNYNANILNLYHCAK